MPKWHHKNRLKNYNIRYDENASPIFIFLFFFSRRTSIYLIKNSYLSRLSHKRDVHMTQFWPIFKWKTLKGDSRNTVAKRTNFFDLSFLLFLYELQQVWCCNCHIAAMGPKATCWRWHNRRRKGASFLKQLTSHELPTPSSYSTRKTAPYFIKPLQWHFCYIELNVIPDMSVY